MNSPSNGCYCNSCIFPHGIDVCINPDDCKVQANISVKRVHCILLWGIVTDCKNEPVADALVKLLKYSSECNNELQEICHTYTDCHGYYQFDLDGYCEGRYHVLVSQCIHEKEHMSCNHTCKEPCRIYEEDKFEESCEQYKTQCKARNRIEYH